MTRIGGLFEGYGGLTMAARAVFGGDLAWVSEFEPATEANPKPTQAPARLLAHRHPDVPNLGNISAIDWPTVESVDVLCGGFPCQDVSSAGKRVGMKPDSRSGLWAHFARAIAVLRPSVVLIENVRGLLSAEAACDLEPCPWCLGDERERPLRALGAVLGDLAALGYDAQWTLVGADSVGAPHERKRVFVVAWPAGDSALRGRDHAQPPRSRRHREPTRSAGGPSRDAADPSGERRGEGRTESARVEWRPNVAECGVGAAADADGDESERRRVGEVVDGPSRPESRKGLQRERAGDAARDGGADALEWGDYTAAIARWQRVLGRPAPGPTQTGKRGGQQLSPRFVEWMMGLPEGWVTDVPDLTRNEQLKLLGNGVVPQQAEHALRLLLAQLAAEAVAA